jgi:ABC-type phosphate transport system substrate-binding protein
MRVKLTIGAVAALVLVAGAVQADPASTGYKHAQTASSEGAVASVVNVEGVKAGRLVLSGKILADIYMGRITMWDAPQIARWNPGVALPHSQIVVIRPDDASPTSTAFTSFLASQSVLWKNQLGSAEGVNWVAGVGGQGDAGVASAVRRTENSIGYVDYSYAIQNGLPLTNVITRQGVSPKMAAPMIAPSKLDVAAPMRAEATALPPPTLGKLSYTANPPSVLSNMTKGDGQYDASKSDDPN